MNLSKLATTAPSKFSKEETKEKTAKLNLQLRELQNFLYAEGKHAVLIVLQGMDASGKDGVINKVFTQVNPAGCCIVPFKKPTEIEMKHDFLWRIHAQVPEKGMIHVFNRSHYEDVLVQRVHKWIDEDTVKKRFVHINNLEKLLVENQTVILKFYLHVSRSEQLKRLNERMKDPSKMWKYNEQDFAERKLWPQYMKAYEDVLDKCNQVAWHIIPSNQNWYKEHLIAGIVVDAMKKLKMKYPVLPKSKSFNN